jgi:Dyp-type peroxidase family
MSYIPSARDLADIQGLVYRAYTGHKYAGFLFARLGDDARRSRAWLESARRDVTSAVHRSHTRHEVVQIALSASGLAALGVPDDARYGLSQEVKDGMAGRARVLDDQPADWSLGGPNDRLDVLVMIYTHDPETRAARLGEHRTALALAGATVRRDELAAHYSATEHFGFVDGISQPFVPGIHEAPERGQTEVAAGEIVLGYYNGYGNLPKTPRWGDFDLGRNGTYRVFRKFEQHVAALWSWIAKCARQLAPGDPAAAAALTEQLGAKLMGRWRSGAPIVLAPDHDDPELAKVGKRNAFGYLEPDPHGRLCPIGSHVRRANPRDAHGGDAADSAAVVERHRIVRRGRNWGERLSHEDALAGRDDGRPRGLYFMALQASIARGFEFIQQTWLSNPGFHDLHDEVDPITGAGGSPFTIPCNPLRLRLPPLPRVMTVAGGEYFFLPSLAALARIAAV